MTYHFIGLGGIGMSALARILLQKGKAVQGSDLQNTALLQQLEKEGAKVCFGHHLQNIQDRPTVVYSTDIKEDNIELKEAKQQGLTVLHRSDLLHELMDGKKPILVSGTHGKTTTSALLSFTLLEAKRDPSFVIGGLLQQLQINGRAGAGAEFVAEADESDGSFLKTNSYAAIVTNIDDDHLDYWGSSRLLNLGFQQFIAQTQHLFWCADSPRLADLRPKGTSYGFSPLSDLQISSFRQTKEGICFDLGAHRDIELSLFGRHNAQNGAAVFGLALFLGVKEETIRSAFRKFPGTCRRLEWKGEKHKVSLFDDYGHHPTEIEATLRALREKIKERRLVVVFQPHRYTRVRDLFEEFTSCFALADELFLTDIYSAQEPAILGISSASLYTRLREKKGGSVHFLARPHLEEGVGAFLKPLDVLLTIGAGDVTKAGPLILEHYEKRAPKWKVALLFGGASVEHPVSFLSAQNILQGLDPATYEIHPFGITKEGKWQRGWQLEPPSISPNLSSEIIQELSSCDVCIPVLHGPQGEDGLAAALCEAIGLRYVGCDFRSSAVCMQKAWAKQIVSYHQVPIVPFFEIEKRTYQERPSWVIEQVEERFSYPVWVKPVHLGSSIGVHRAEDYAALQAFIEEAFSLDDRILVEPQIEGRQIEFSILGKEILQIAPPGEILNHGDFVGYDQKYGSGAMPIETPAKLSEVEEKIGQELALRVYRALDCKGLSRIDFFLDAKGHYWFNEINPFPGFTKTSAYPKMWQAAGYSLSEILDSLLAAALHKSFAKEQQ